MSISTKLSSNFKTYVPKEVREQQGWRAGQEFVFMTRGASVVLVPVPEREELFGIAKGANPDGYRDRTDCY